MYAVYSDLAGHWQRMAEEKLINSKLDDGRSNGSSSGHEEAYCSSASNRSSEEDVCLLGERVHSMESLNLSESSEECCLYPTVEGGGEDEEKIPEIVDLQTPVRDQEGDVQADERADEEARSNSGETSNGQRRLSRRSRERKISVTSEQVSALKVTC